MSPHQYACPRCGVTLQSATDVTGKQVRCLGCRAVFTATRAAPAPVPRPQRATSPPAPARSEPPRSPEPRNNGPARPANRVRKVRPELAEAPTLPPIPKKRSGLGVLVHLLLAVSRAGGGTFVLIKKLKVRNEEPAPVVAKAPSPPKVDLPAPPAEPELPLTSTSSPRREEEEDVPVGPGTTQSGTKPKNPKETDPALPDPTKPIVKGPEEKPKEPAPPVAVAPKEPETVTPPPAPPVTKKETPPDPAEPATAADGQIPASLLAKLKAATAFIKVHAPTYGATGSGFVLRVDGDTALIVTNDHVVVERGKSGIPDARDTQYEVVFHSGQRKEFVRRGEVIATDRDHDLAIVRVHGVREMADFPAPLNTTDKVAVSETMPIYIIGFPFGEKLSASKGNPSVSINKGTVSSVRDDDAGDTAYIQIDGDINPGNSGGPVVDSRGRLVGVTRAKFKGSNIGMAIPSVEVSRLLAGRVGNLDFRLGRTLGTTIEVEVHGNLIDPLNRVSSASIRLVRADSLEKKPKVGTDGKWTALPKSEK